uniref:DEX1 C-terminal domain-containing protein n=1 Tax=Arion vulgaris TaxID=1028688 RepID=A0A0B7AVA1_9EUPU
MLSVYRTIIFFRLLMLCLSSAEDGIASKQMSEQIRKRCPYRMRKLWQTDVSSFPFAATPLVVDVDGDGGLDIVAAPFGESLAVIEGETGKPLHDTSWPQHNLDKSLHSSPLQYDVDEDGVLDILFMTTQGEGLFYSRLGHALNKYTFQLDAVFIKSDWYKTASTVGYQDIHKYVTDKPIAGYIEVDAHILSTPVVHNMHLLVIPVSFYFDDDEDGDNYRKSAETEPQGHTDSRDKFYVGAVAILDLKQLQISKSHGDTVVQDLSFIKLFYLELSQTPVMTLFTPTVIDVDGNFREPEIIIGLTSGNLYVLSLDGKHRPGFPVTVGSISGRIAAANLDKDSGLELVVMDTNGIVNCLDSKTGRIKWSTNVGGKSFAGSQIVDVDLDGRLDVVVATDVGKIFALHGDNGSVLTNYPFKTGRRIAGHVLVTRFNALRGPVDLVFLSDDGELHILAGDHSCLSQVALTDFSLVDILVQNVVLMNRGMELIVSTSDGSLICLGSGSESPPEELYEEEYLVMSSRIAYPSSPHSYNDFIFTVNKILVLIDGKFKARKEVTGSSFDLYLTIFGAGRGQKLDVRVYMGSIEVHQEMMTDVGSTRLKIQAPEQPGQAQVTVAVYDEHGFVATDSIFLKFNQLILLDLQWLVLAPFIAMVVILLVNHGFPAKDLLPITFPFKSK